MIEAITAYTSVFLGYITLSADTSITTDDGFIKLGVVVGVGGRSIYLIVP
jgi:hypothetical protein